MVNLIKKITLNMILSNVEGLGKWSKKEIEVQCDNCQLEKKMTYHLYTSYGYENGNYLCKKCKLKKNNLEKFGVENVFQLESVKEKTKKTNLVKFGVEYVSQSEELQEKIKKSKSQLDNNLINEKRKLTNLEKWGVENVSQNDEIKNKKIETSIKNNKVEYIFQTEEFRENLKKNNLRNYGVEYLFQSEEFKMKSKEINLEKWGVDNPSKNNLIKEKIKKSLNEKLTNKIITGDDGIFSITENKFYQINCINCKQDFSISRILFYKRRETKTEICTVCNPVDKHQSGKEIKLYNFIKSIYDGEIIQNYRLEKQELDVFLPQFNLGIELNGVHWHSDTYKDKNFHINKSDFFKDKNIHVFHVWEDDFDNKLEIIQSQIKNILNLSKRISARKCQAKVITNPKIVRKFLDDNHMLGFVNSNIKVGLFHQDELVSLMTFDKFEGRNKMSDLEWNLNRFCNKINVSVIGGASKLLNFFVNTFSPKRIISYADKDWSKGNLYEKLNFTKIYETEPDYKYVIKGKRIHKSNLKTSATGVSESKLELPKIWDCGKIKYELIL